MLYGMKLEMEMQVGEVVGQVERVVGLALIADNINQLGLSPEAENEVETENEVEAENKVQAENEPNIKLNKTKLN